MRSKFETPFAILTLAAAFLHFSGETYYHLVYGQPLPSYLVDLIAIALMGLGSVSALWRRRISSAGWLAAGWAFTLCLNYRSFFGRVYAQQAGEGYEEPSMVVTILGITLITNACACLFALWLARPRSS